MDSTEATGYLSISSHDLEHVVFYKKIAPCRRVLIAKFITAQLVKKYPDCLGT
jgi:hypothetical protein